MSIINIKATVECDRCAKRFEVELDPATKTYGAQLFDYVEEAVAIGYHSEFGELRPTSVVGDAMLCDSCTAATEGDPDPPLCLFDEHGGACDCPKCAPLSREGDGIFTYNEED